MPGDLGVTETLSLTRRPPGHDEHSIAEIGGPHALCHPYGRRDANGSAAQTGAITAETAEVIADRERLGRRVPHDGLKTGSFKRPEDAFAREVMQVGGDHGPPAAPK